MAAFFELRDYRIKDGKRDQWAKWMEEQVIPFQTQRGDDHRGELDRPGPAGPLHLDAPLRERGTARGAEQGGLRGPAMEGGVQAGTSTRCWTDPGWWSHG